MKFKTLLVDAPYLLKRSVHGAKNSYTKAGFMGGLYSFMTTLRKLIKQYGVNKVVLFWDGDHSGFYRYKMDSKYKANRDKEWRVKTEFVSEEQKKFLQNEKQSETVQKEKIMEYAEELYLRQIEVEYIEADDLIAYYVMKKNGHEDMIIYTNDRDYLQLLDFNVEIHYDGFDYPVSSGNYHMFFPYHYKNSLTIKILCGDTSDNVDGIQGLGMETLFKHFPDFKSKNVMVKDVLIGAKKIQEQRTIEGKKPLKVFENLLGGLERLKLNYELMNLTAPILTDEAIDALEQLEMPLAEEDEKGSQRGSKNLLKLMERDDFLSLYSNQFTFVNYVEPFYTVITTEKAVLKEYNENLQKK